MALELVARHEFEMHLRRRSFLFTTALVPLVGVGISLALGLGGVMGAGRLGVPGLGVLASPTRPVRVGYVDPAGFIRRLPPDGPFVFRAYLSERAVRQALRRGQVEVAYLFDQDYPRVRTAVRLAAGLTPPQGDQQALDALLRANLWPQASSAQLADLADPMRRVSYVAASPAAGRRPSDTGTASASGSAAAVSITGRLLPAVVGMLLYSTIFMMSSFLLQSVTTEKENRIVEVLITSISPLQLLAGKVVGLALLGLVQLAVWAAAGLLLAASGAPTIASAMSGLSPGVALLALSYFLMGYLFYASLMAAVGAVAPSFQDSGPLTFVVLAPGWLPLAVLQPLLRAPDALPARVLSLLPPTSPLVMLLRLTATRVPLAEVTLSLVALLAGSAGVLWLAARLFRAGLLLSATYPSLHSVRRALGL